jgi:hypothetical protein
VLGRAVMGVLAVCAAVVVLCMVSSLVSAASGVRACTRVRKPLLDGRDHRGWNSWNSRQTPARGVLASGDTKEASPRTVEVGGRCGW